MSSIVSMVIPCFNKAKHISGMLQSVHDQTWNHIELILVNDGSTDDTRAVVEEWLPKFHSRGIETVVIDQENQGVAAAVHNGMLHMTGDYFCTVDADDELHPEYVATMAGFLDVNHDYEWAACGVEEIDFDEKGGSGFYRYGVSPPYLENFILRRNLPTAWIYMSRMTYANECRVVENFITHLRTSQEPSIVIPLAAGDGKLRYFPQPLYRYRQRTRVLSYHSTYAEHAGVYDRYAEMSRHAVLHAAMETKRRDTTLLLIEYKRLQQRMFVARHHGHPDEDELMEEFIGFIKKNMHICTEPENWRGAEADIWGRMVEMAVLGNSEPRISPTGRVIGYGALGKMAALRIPQLMDTPLYPDVLWDAGASLGSNVGGVPVLKPDIGSLTESDTVIIFPTMMGIAANIRSSLELAEVSSIVDNADLVDCISRHRLQMDGGA